MTVCPKCRCRRIVGPRFEPTFYGDRLVYGCYRCGYEEQRMPLDAEKEGTDS